MNVPGLTHLSFRVDDLATTVDALERAGVETLAHTRFDDPAHGSAAVFLRDPDGVRIELVQAPGDPDAPLSF
jgi:catechol 2,3-dioxygenase-like lactoylglutathione lyase family enzyme